MFWGRSWTASIVPRFGEITGHYPRPPRKSKNHDSENDDEAASNVRVIEYHSADFASEVWYESEIGRSILAEDRSFFLGRFRSASEGHSPRWANQTSWSLRNGSALVTIRDDG
jgi:hypothetical protein